ncbi:MAG: phospholipid carrier-dependent glycosyltransferase [Chloroflexi bacterium]|nr:phospholipid carrier-dependent glycosyltransferase [Chloroflexota bacterium]
MTKLSVPGRYPKWIDIFCLLLLAAYVLAGASLVPFHGDESTQMFMGRDSYYLFQDGDLSKILYDSAWSSRPDEQHLRLINGTVTKTIHGFLSASAGMRRDEINGQWDWELDYAANRDLGHIPDAQLLQRARLASALQLAVSVALFYALIRMTIGRPVAIVASGLYALHPALLLNGRRAMMEGAHLLGMMLVLLSAAWLLRERGWIRFIVLGICSGAAVAAKHPNAFVVAMVFLACGSLFIYEMLRFAGPARSSQTRSIAGLILAGVIALLVFYLMNPAWWLAPFESGVEAFSLRVALFQDQVATYGGDDSLIERVRGFLRYIFVENNQYYEVAQWADYSEITGQVRSYEASGLAGASIGGSAAGGLLNLALTIVGGVQLLRSRDIEGEYRWLLVVLGGGIALITLAATPLPWLRYYLPVLPFTIILSAYALVRLAALCRADIKRRFARLRALQ